MNDDALTAYSARTNEAAELLDRLTAYIEDHGEIAPDAVTWEHVGDMGHICELLREAVNFAYGEGNA